jgi:hypothetical protein
MLISLPVQSEASLKKASKFLNAFNQYKKAFDDVCSTSIPKIHSLQHYREYIQNFGTPDNFDTEYTEHQHIIDAKQPYLHTNKQNHVAQMIHHVECRMVLENKNEYLESLQHHNSNQPVSYRCFLGSRVKDCPMLISRVSNKYGVDLELYLWTFLHNQLYPEGDGSRHRVKKCKCPALDNTEVINISPDK